MQELVPLVLGTVIGIALGARPGRRALALGAALSAVLGVCLAWVVGELAESIVYAFYDVGLTAGTAAAVVVALRAVRRRRPDRDTPQEV
jgi:FtsH-binding integral membrane protein